MTYNDYSPPVAYGEDFTGCSIIHLFIDVLFLALRKNNTVQQTSGDKNIQEQKHDLFVNSGVLTAESEYELRFCRSGQRFLKNAFDIFHNFS